MKHMYASLIIGGIILLAMSSCSKHVDTLSSIDVNGVNLCYRTVGTPSATPVILIHGNGGSHAELSATAEVLDSAGYLVYAPDSRGQGANAPLNEYHYADMAEDMYQFIQTLGLEQPAVFGWSDGGIIALLTEILHPGTFAAISASGANVTPDGVEGFELDKLDSIREAHSDDSPLYKMMLYEPDITPEQMATIACPTQIVAGEYDLIRETHTRYIAACIPCSELLILPGETHGSHIVDNHKMGEELVLFLAHHNIVP